MGLPLFSRLILIICGFVFLFSLKVNAGPPSDPEIVAKILALEWSGDREVSDPLADAIYQDLELIYDRYPGLAGLPVGVRWDHTLIVRIHEEEDDEILIEGILSQWPELEYERLIGHITRMHVFALNPRFHTQVIAEEVNSFSGVADASASGWIGGFSNVNIDADTGDYLFTFGWGDCPSGCINNLIYRISVSEENEVILRSRTGPHRNSPSLNFYPHHASSVLRLAEGRSLTLESSEMPGLDMQWFKGDQPIGEPGASFEIESLSLDDSGVYSIGAVDAVSGEGWMYVKLELVVMDSDYHWNSRTHIHAGQLHGVESLDRLQEAEHPIYGDFNAKHYPWLKLEQHGWWYELWPGQETVYWDSEMGWLYAPEDTPGYFYSLTKQKWFAAQNLVIEDQRLFYDINNDDWKWFARAKPMP